MSRCFPFPPPGYEKEPRPEDGDLLKEEKRKEKKHKKEKKDREKKEGKEKRDKDRSDGKHREKKDKKDKHRDKKEKHKDKKDKEKDKDKERSDISEEARVAVLPGVSSGQKLPSRDEHLKKESVNSQEAKYRDLSQGRHAEKLFKTSLPTVETEESKFVQELARRIRNEQKGAGSQLAERFPVESKRDDKTNSMYHIKDFGNFVEEKEKKQEKRVYSNKMDGHQVRVEPRIGVNSILPSFPDMAKSKFHGLPPLEENVESRREEKEKSKEKRDDKPREKKKDKEKDAKSHAKEKDREKEKKMEKKAKDKSAHRKSEPDKSRDINNKSDFFNVSNTNHQVPLVPKDNIAGIVTEGNIRKRKEIEINGFLHESEVRPAKLPRPSSSHHPTQNGKISDTHQKAEMLSSNKQGVTADVQVVNKERSVNGTNKQGVTADVQVVNKERSVNGTIKLSNKHGVATDIGLANKENRVDGTVKGQPLAMSKPKASSMSPGADQFAEASRRPPHPDSKYLNQILSVPKMDEWSGIDDQEWLFGSKSTLVWKPDMCLDEVNDSRVWSEALQIDSADVCALPYVIPY